MVYFEILDSAGDPRVSKQLIHNYFPVQSAVIVTLYAQRNNFFTSGQLGPKRKYNWLKYDLSTIVHYSKLIVVQHEAFSANPVW